MNPDACSASCNSGSCRPLPLVEATTAALTASGMPLRTRRSPFRLRTDVFATTAMPLEAATPPAAPALLSLPRLSFDALLCTRCRSMDVARTRCTPRLVSMLPCGVDPPTASCRSCSCDEPLVEPTASRAVTLPSRPPDPPAAPPAADAVGGWGGAAGSTSARNSAGSRGRSCKSSSVLHLQVQSVTGHSRCVSNHSARCVAWPPWRHD